MPPFSPLLNRLIATLADEDARFASIAEIIEKDAVLAGRVLRLVNSVRHAVALLGIRKLRNFALGFSIASPSRRAAIPASWSQAKFNLHCAATAVLADLLALRMPVNYAEGAFTAGLLHDVGKLLIAVSCPGPYERILRSGWDVNVERELIGATHLELSAAILGRWRLPVEIQHAVGGKGDLARVVGLADQFAAGQPAGTLAGHGVDDAIPAIVAEFEKEFEAIRAFF